MCRWSTRLPHMTYRSLEVPPFPTVKWYMDDLQALCLSVSGGWGRIGEGWQRRRGIISKDANNTSKATREAAQVVTPRVCSFTYWMQMTALLYAFYPFCWRLCNNKLCPDRNFPSIFPVFFWKDNAFAVFLSPPPFGEGLYSFTRVRIVPVYVCMYVCFRRRSEDTGRILTFNVYEIDTKFSP